MANIKDFTIEFTAPFDVMQPDWNNNPRPLLLRLGPVLLSPTMYARYETHHERDVKNEHGGWTALYRWKITGQEAISYKWFDALREDLMQEKGVTVHRMDVLDIENLEVSRDGHR